MAQSCELFELFIIMYVFCKLSKKGESYNLASL